MGSSRVIGTILTWLGRDPGRHAQTVVVAVGHHHRADHPGGEAPGGRVAELSLAVLVGELHLHRPGEVLAEVVGGPALQRLAVLHHRLDAEGGLGAREALVLRLLAGDHRNRQQRLGELAVDAEHPPGLLERLLLGRVGGVPLLPEELGGAQQHPRAQLPADDVRPLVDQQRQVAVGVDPLGEGAADDRLGGGADDQRLGQLGGRMQGSVLALLEPVVRDHRHLLGEALDVLGLLLEVAQRDEEREVGVLRRPVSLIASSSARCISSQMP